MTREEKIAKIYKVIQTEPSKWNELAIYAMEQFWMNKAWPIMQGIVSKFEELCWPRIMIWDVLDYLDKNCDNKYYKWKFWKEPMFDWTITNVRNGMHVVVCNNINADFLKRIYVSWEYKEKSLEDQPDECIDFIYSLVKDA